ncbi:MAG: hypothetical protein FJ190_11880 [Gammaproteobacteria bacterium]|nr:hypothetical protein [Gammaproteobacteria bacterium]
MFYFSLPILFNDIQWVSPLECLLITLGVLVLLYLSAPQTGQHGQQTSDSFLLSAWLGELPLHWVFWPFFLFLNASLLCADLLAKAGKITVSSWDEIHFALLLTVIWWTIGVWRCSANTAHKIWAALARLTTLAVFLEYGLKLLIRIDYPRIFFNCEDILLDYGSCF